MSGINLTTIEEINQKKALIIPAHYNPHYNQAKILWALGVGSAGIAAFVLFFQNLALRSKAKSIASKSWEATKKPFVFIWENYINYAEICRKRDREEFDARIEALRTYR